MRRFIFGERSGVYIIDLLKTSALLAQHRLRRAARPPRRHGAVRRHQEAARDTIRDVAQAADMPFVNHRWLGGLLTTPDHQPAHRRLHDSSATRPRGQLALFRQGAHGRTGGSRQAAREPWVASKTCSECPMPCSDRILKTELIAVREAQRLRIPIIGLVDTNCDPDGSTT